MNPLSQALSSHSQSEKTCLVRTQDYFSSKLKVFIQLGHIDLLKMIYFNTFRNLCVAVSVSVF